jgi:hypothetical protein
MSVIKEYYRHLLLNIQNMKKKFCLYVAFILFL